MLLFSMAGFILASMLLGVYVGEQKIGSNPFVLIRELPENFGLPWTMIPDYLKTIPMFEDGRGLNPLLQNYWMTIHPPTLFLGFALTLVPFAFSAASIMRNSESSWLSDVRPWAFAGIAVLGTGILMGGAWAYEALSFGGFWAWDPVENASLVPWLLLVAGGHMILVARKRKVHVFSAHLFSALAFLFIIYSTFLTRSGILGETSVHSFTDNGMIGQLLIFLLATLAFSVDLLSYRLDQGIKKLHRIVSALLIVVMIFTEYVVEATFLFVLLQLVMLLKSAFKKEKEKKDDHFSSREFWMFLGALILVLSSIQITFSTSIPVFNKILEPFTGMFNDLANSTNIKIFKELAKAKFAPPSDAIAHYNKWQSPLAILLLLALAIAQDLKYKKSNWSEWLKRNVYFLVGSAIFTWLTIHLFEYRVINYLWIFLLFAAFYALIVNGFFVWKRRKKLKLEGATMFSHLGFGAVLLGAFISGGQQVKISENSSNVDVRNLSTDFNNQEDLLLFKGDTLLMENYFVSYRDKYKDGINIYYQVDFFAAVEHQYNEGEIANAGGASYKCISTHTASNSFFDNSDKWEMVDYQPKAKKWLSKQCGEKLYTLEPRVQLNPRFGNVPEPDTKHHLGSDVFTHVKWAELEEPVVDENGFLEAQHKEVQLGDTLFLSKNFMVFDDVLAVANPTDLGFGEKDIVIQSSFKLYNEDGVCDTLSPLYIVRDSSFVIPNFSESKQEGVKIEISKLLPQAGALDVHYYDHVDNRREFIVFQAIVFPGVNILWIGCVLMAIGGLWSAFRRTRKKSNA